MFDNTNHYTLRTEVVEGITRYHVSFHDGQAIHRETEVSRLVYLEFLRSVRYESNLRRSDRRHMKQSDLTDETLYNRAFNPPKNVEDLTIDSLRDEWLQLTIQRLPEIQRRRFVLYHEFGLTYEQITKMEGCSFQAVAVSVKTAETSIKKSFIEQG